MHPRRYLEHPALAGFALVEHGPARMLVRRGLETSAALLGLHGDPAAAESIAGGRAKHPVVGLPDGTRAVVRRYHRGGAVRHVNRWTYFAGHRAFDELLATETARAAGVRVPLVLAATERRAGLGYHAWLATRVVEGAVESAAWLASAPAGARLAMLREAGRQIARMHDAGIAHPDLNLRNLLVSADVPPPTDAPDSADGSRSPDSVDAQGSAERPAPDASGSSPSMDGGRSEPVVHLIDFDGARLFGRPAPVSARARNLMRLGRSILKLRAPVGQDGWAAMAEGYGADWPFPPAPARG